MVISNGAGVGTLVIEGGHGLDEALVLRRLLLWRGRRLEIA